jgi:aconitase A
MSTIILNNIHYTITKGKSCHNCSNHLEELPVFLKIRLARNTIAKFCQKVKDTLNQDKISPSNHASKNSPATARTIKPKATPKAVEVFIII